MSQSSPFPILDAANEEIQHSEKELELELQKEYEEVETLLEDGIQMPKVWENTQMHGIRLKSVGSSP